MPLAAPLAARAALDEGADTLLVDVAGPVPFAVAEGELLLLAAAARAPGDPSADPVVQAAARGVLEAEPGVTGLLLSAHLVTTAEPPVAAGPAGAGEPAVGLVWWRTRPCRGTSSSRCSPGCAATAPWSRRCRTGCASRRCPLIGHPTRRTLLSPRVSRTRHHEGHD